MSATEASYFGTYPYGEFYYGVNPSLIHQADFFITLTGTPIGYSSAVISWSRPLAPNITQLMLRRQKFNSPVDENAGQEVYSGTTGNATQVTDTALTGGGFFYYTMFGFDDTIPAPQPGQSTGISQWRRLADFTLLVPLAYNFGMLLYQRLPGFYRDNDNLLVNFFPAQQQSTNPPPLQQFLSLVGFQLDQIRTQMDSLLLVNDPLNCSGDLLPYISQELGMPYEIEMGMAQVRDLAYNAVHLYKNKGTALGIADFCSSLTGWPVPPVVMGPNRLLQRSDGDITFTNFWRTPTTTTVPGFPAISLPSTNANSVTVGIGTEISLTGLSPPNYNNSGVATPLTRGIELSFSSAPPSSPNNNIFVTGAGLPAIDFLNNEGVGACTLSVWIYNVIASARAATWYLYDESGTLLNSQTFTLPAAIGTTCQMSTAINISTDAAVPRWLVPVLEISDCVNGDAYYLSAFAAYNVLTPPTLYDLPRDLKITVEPQTANLFGNPLTFGTHFLYGLDGWLSLAVTNNLSVVTGTNPAPVFGTAFLEVTTVSVSGSWVVPEVEGGQITVPATESGYTQNPGNFEGISVFEDLTYSFSAYVAGAAATVGKTFEMGIVFTLATGQVITTTTTQTLLPGFSRYSVSAVGPPDVVSAVTTFSSNDPGLTAADIFYLNAAMFENATLPSPYFDIWTAGVDPDFRLGVNGQSLFYENIGAKLPRLMTLLPNWIPMGATYTVILALGAVVPTPGGVSPTTGITFPFVLPTAIP